MRSKEGGGEGEGGRREDYRRVKKGRKSDERYRGEQVGKIGYTERGVDRAPLRCRRVKEIFSPSRTRRGPDRLTRAEI